MIRMSLSQIAEVVGGVAHGEAVVSAPAFVDTRAPEVGGLFVAVLGERVDGHDFVPQALAGGAAAVLGSRPTEAPTVVVSDVIEALGLLARHVRDAVAGMSVLAVTGSQGKTGVKDYLAAILRGAGETVATSGNHNNELGVPLTVLRVSESTRYLVVEMGARGVGHISYLCNIARPDVAAVLNVGTAHIGEFGDRDTIALAKGEIIEALPAGGTAVLNAADPYVAAMAPRTSAAVVTFGAGGDVVGEDVAHAGEGRYAFTLSAPDGRAPVRLLQRGAHQVDNALAAAAMAAAVGVGVAEAAERLSAAQASSRWRMEVHERADGMVVVNDAYNANPDSTIAALVALADMGPAPRRTVAVLGEMYELGPDEVSGHRRVGERAAQLGIDVLVCVGPLAREIAHGAAGVAGWQGDAVVTAGRDDALAWLVQNGSSADVVLVKASRGAALEKIVEALNVEGTVAG